MTRLIDAWRELEGEQRRAALAAFGLFVSMLLPWYSKTVVEGGKTSHLQSGQSSLNAFQAFSFVEAAVLLISAGVLAMLFARGERREFNLPGGDGLIVAIAGGWAALLIFYRLLDKPGLEGNQRITATVGVEWGIFIALLVALGLLYVGTRMRAHERGQPPRQRRGDRERMPARAGDPGGTPPPRDAGGMPAPQRARPARDEEAETVIAAPARRSPGSGPMRPATPAPEPGTPAPAPATPAGERSPRRGRPRYPPAPSDQMSFEDAPPERE